MAKNIASGTTTYEIVESDETYNLKKSATRDVDGADGIFAGDGTSLVNLNILGKVMQSGDGYAAIRTDAENMTIHIAKTGNASGYYGIYSEGFEPSSKLKITIDGKLSGSEYAIMTADSKEVIVNNGTITGKIHLGSGNDTFDNRDGKITRNVEGGAGDDTLIVDNAKNKLIENGGSEGYDTVKSEVSYTLSENVEKLVLLGKANLNGKGNDDQSDLYGNSGNNKLYGFDGVDILDGKKGSDSLYGGEGADTFVFKTGYGHDTIMDFEEGLDKLDLRKWNAIKDFADLADHASSKNGDLYIKVGNDVLRINDTKLNDLDPDFVMI
ncbi:M10 family metallopeptidase C-terminal domain-containing protein [Rhizobium sp.]